MDYQLEKSDPLDSRQFEIAVKSLADSLSYGTDASPFLGSGTEYVQSRQYQPGDPIRTIDWRITARTGKYHVKEFETPKRMPCYILLDTSASMTVSSIKQSKYAAGVFIAGGIAFACLDRISPVSLMGVGEREIHFPTSLSRGKIMQWLHKLRSYSYRENTEMEQRLAELGPLLLNKSLIIVISDLHQPDAITPLKQLGQRHDVVAIQMVDPAEAGIRGAGFIRGREAETGRQITTRGKNLGIDQKTLDQELKRGRVDHVLVQTDQPFAYRLRHFFKSRGLLGRGAR